MQSKHSGSLANYFMMLSMEKRRRQQTRHRKSLSHPDAAKAPLAPDIKTFAKSQFCAKDAGYFRRRSVQCRIGVSRSPVFIAAKQRRPAACGSGFELPALGRHNMTYADILILR
jgi:hypothetical protein